jgi:hypothetical protein
MGLPSSFSFRSSQIDPTSMVPAAPRQVDAPAASDRFERHLDENRPKDDRKVDRRDDRRQRDRTESARDAQKADSDTQARADADETVEDAAAPIVAVQAPVAPVADTKPVTADAGEKPTGTDATAPALDTGDLLAADEAGDVKPEAGKDAEAGKTPILADANAAKTDKKETTKDTAAVAPETVAQVPVAAHVDAHLKTAKAPKAETKSGVAPVSAPVPASQAPLAAAASSVNTSDDTPKTSSDVVDPDAGLAIKSKEGLGHEAAAGMAEKSDAKTNAAQQTPSAQTAQTQTAQTASAPANFARMVAAATGGETAPASTTSGGDGAAARLTDLQNVGGNTQNQNSNTATVRIGTLPGQTTPTQVPAMAIALQVARNLQKGANRFDIRLDPAEMGRIDVRMEVKKDGNVAAHLTVDRPETLDLLQRDARALQQALNDAGLQANADSLNFSLRDQNAGGNAQNFNADAAGTSSTSAGTTAEETVASPVYNINVSASGGVDIRV